MIKIYTENEEYTYKTIREMTKITGLESKFIKYHLKLGQIYLSNKLFNIIEE